MRIRSFWPTVRKPKGPNFMDAVLRARPNEGVGPGRNPPGRRDIIECDFVRKATALYTKPILTRVTPESDAPVFFLGVEEFPEDFESAGARPGIMEEGLARTEVGRWSIEGPGESSAV